MADRKINLKVLTQAYNGDLDNKFLPNVNEIIRRGDVSRLVIISKQKFPRVEDRAMHSRIPVLYYDAPKEFNKAYNEENTPLRAGQGYTVCITEDLTAATRVLKGVKRANVELSTEYKRSKLAKLEDFAH